MARATRSFMFCRVWALMIFSRWCSDTGIGTLMF